MLSFRTAVLISLFIFSASILTSCGSSGGAIAVAVDWSATEQQFDATSVEELGLKNLAGAGSNGLLRAYLVSSENTLGAIFLFASKPAADRFLDARWRQKAERRFGEIRSMTAFEVVESLFNHSLARDADAAAAVSIVKVSAPWYAPRFVIRAKIADAVPGYKQIEGLSHKLFTISEDKKPGGIYLWDNTDDAKQFYDQAWQQRIVDTYGEAADLSVYVAPSIYVLDQVEHSQ